MKSKVFEREGEIAYCKEANSSDPKCIMREADIIKRSKKEHSKSQLTSQYFSIISTINITDW